MGQNYSNDRHHHVRGGNFSCCHLPSPGIAGRKEEKDLVGLSQGGRGEKKCCEKCSGRRKEVKAGFCFRDGGFGSGGGGCADCGGLLLFPSPSCRYSKGKIAGRVWNAKKLPSSFFVLERRRPPSPPPVLQRRHLERGEEGGDIMR